MYKKPERPAKIRYDTTTWYFGYSPILINHIFSLMPYEKTKYFNISQFLSNNRPITKLTVFSNDERTLMTFKL